jgi:hypothetical protein
MAAHRRRIMLAGLRHGPKLPPVSAMQNWRLVT